MSAAYPPNDGQPPHEVDPVDLTEEEIAAAEAAGLEEIAALEAEISSLNERMLRVAAELENTRRRAEREKLDAGRYAIAQFARDLLGVVDNFERALAAAPEGGDAVPPETSATIIAGLRMTERTLSHTLERHGVVRIDPIGEKFDPNKHQAVAQAPAPGVQSGHIAAVAQPGFMLADRVLRAAMVVVSTGEPAAANGQRVDTTA
jgi:molecular chaperone GrpE